MATQTMYILEDSLMLTCKKGQNSLHCGVQITLKSWGRDWLSQNVLLFIFLYIFSGKMKTKIAIFNYVPYHETDFAM